MRYRISPKRTLLLASFFYAWSASGLASNPCGPTRIDGQVEVARIYDGDTVRLADGTHLRFIGINTPELAHDSQPAEPLADAATRRLRQLLNTGNQLQLQFGAERHDHYGRLLAHPFLSDGRNLSALLLEEGLGFQIVVPPNLALASCYREAEQTARQHHRGIWGNRDLHPIPARQLATSDTGFRRISGRISRVGESPTAFWLNMGHGFALRIPKKDLPYFGFSPRDLLGRTLTVRGWVYDLESTQELRMNLRHPAMIEDQ